MLDLDIDDSATCTPWDLEISGFAIHIIIIGFVVVDFFFHCGERIKKYLDLLLNSCGKSCTQKRKVVD